MKKDQLVTNVVYPPMALIKHYGRFPFLYDISFLFSLADVLLKNTL